MARPAKRKTSGSRKAGRSGSAKRAAASAGERRWTKEKEEIFFAELGTVCNVSAALRKAGLLTAKSVFERRLRRDPEFRALWDETIAQSYALLELEMIERARYGDDRRPPKTAAEARQREIPTKLAMQLLRQHGNRARPRPVSFQRPMRGQKLRDELEKRLAEINRRLGGAG